MNTFLLCPQLSGYDFQHGQNFLEQPLRSGIPRQLKVSINAPHRVQASVWCGNALEQEYFWAFWRKHLDESSFFKWGIKIDSGYIEECECKFSIDVPQASERVADKCRYSFNLYVKPKYRSKVNDENLIELWNLGLNDKTLPLIELIPNVWLPEALGVE